MRASLRLPLVLAVLGLLFLAACKGEPGAIKCKAANDCYEADSSRDRAVWTASCVDKACKFSPKPDVCGNGKWEPASDKDCAACARDCKGPGSSPRLKLTCIRDACLDGIPENDTKVTASSLDLTAGGNRFRLDTAYPDPFNIRQHAFDLTFTLRALATDVTDLRITRFEMQATTPTKAVLTVAEASVDVPLSVVGGKGEARLALDFPVSGDSGQLTAPTLTIDASYRLKGVPKTATVKASYKTPINWVTPKKEYDVCPACPEKAGFTGDCLPGTVICIYTPQAGQCGNNLCEPAEDRCTCPGDCGPCAGAAGSYMDYACVQDACKAQVRPGVAQEMKSIVDPRDLGPAKLSLKYLYDSPFNVAADKLGIEVTMTETDPDVSGMTIAAIQVLEGANELVAIAPKKRLELNKLARFDLTIPAQAKPEQDRTLTLQFAYEYTKGDLVKATFVKQLGKLTLLSPG
jgi:hypothetical protein